MEWIKLLPETVILDNEGLSLEDVVHIVKNDYQLKLSENVKEKVVLARKAIEKAVESGEKIYGITTGFGALRDIVIPEKDATKLQTNLIRSHCVGVGEPARDDFVKAMMVLRVTALGQGYSGCQLKTLENLIQMINKNVLPIIPIKGSVGASGDLAQLSHMVLAMIGEGENNLKFEGKIYNAKEGMQKAGVPITKLSYKEGLALNNGSQYSAGIACIVLHEASNLIKNAEIAAALSLEALKAASQQFDDRIHQARFHPGQIAVAKNLRSYTKGSVFVKKHESLFTCEVENCGYYYDRKMGDASQNVLPNTEFINLPDDWTCPNCGGSKDNFEKQWPKIQDDYSIRCTPQVLGPVRETLEHCWKTISREINAATDNPLIFITKKDPLEFDIYSGGNFHGEPIAMVMDYLSIAMAEVGNISERRCAKLIDDKRNDGLSLFLIPRSELGLNSGFMMPQYTAAALVSENKVLAAPASVDSIPTSDEAEDHVSMSPIAARKTAEILENLQYIIAIEMMLAVQAIDLRCDIQKIPHEKALGKDTLKAYKVIRESVSKLIHDRIIYPDINKIADLIKSGKIIVDITT
ncbi:MAG: histidine ammonia-lyase [Candidatus Heimdallarchaeota archaeon]|nr:MAG: histidine ammonia-lyase [Candidatus Heimdallarchaeota archaeon]